MANEITLETGPVITVELGVSPSTVDGQVIRAESAASKAEAHEANTITARDQSQTAQLAAETARDQAQLASDSLNLDVSSITAAQDEVLSAHADITAKHGDVNTWHAQAQLAATQAVSANNSVQSAQVDVAAKSEQVSLDANAVSDSRLVVEADQMDVASKHGDITTAHPDVVSRHSEVITRHNDISLKHAEVVTSRDEAVSAQVLAESARDQVQDLLASSGIVGTSKPVVIKIGITNTTVGPGSSTLPVTILDNSEDTDVTTDGFLLAIPFGKYEAARIVGSIALHDLMYTGRRLLRSYVGVSYSPQSDGPTAEYDSLCQAIPDDPGFGSIFHFPISTGKLIKIVEQAGHNPRISLNMNIGSNLDGDPNKSVYTSNCLFTVELYPASLS